MTDDAELAGLNASDLLDREAARLDAFFSALADDEWSRPSRCAGWSTRDVLAHLTATEAYHHACLDGKVQALIQGMASKGATDLHGFNALGISELSDRSPAQLVEQWREANAETRRRLRERGDAEVDTSVGTYPARWQAFHVASELATHADDISVPVTAEERDERRAWRAHMSRFALGEERPELHMEAKDGRTRVQGADLDVTVDDDQLIEAVAGRLAGSPLSIMP